MNSNDLNFDWHKPGVYLAHNPEGHVLLATVGGSGHGARAELLRLGSQPWSSLRKAGYTIQEYVPEIPVLTDVIKVGDQVATSSADHWRYPAAGNAAPAGVTVQLLTRGGVAVRGVWNDLGDYIAWAPMIKRDKELEERLEL